MPYCTLQDLKDEFGETELIQLTDEAGAGVVNSVTIDKAIARADRKINRYLASRADLPLSADDMVDLACDITRYYLFADGAPEIVKDRFNDAVKELEKMANRKIAVADTAGSVQEPTSEDVIFQSAPTVFGRE